MGNYIIIGLLFLAVVVSGACIIRDIRAGKHPSCGGDCSRCAMGCDKNKEEK